MSYPHNPELYGEKVGLTSAENILRRGTAIKDSYRMTGFIPVTQLSFFIYDLVRSDLVSEYTCKLFISACVTDSPDIEMNDTLVRTLSDILVTAESRISHG